MTQNSWKCHLIFLGRSCLFNYAQNLYQRALEQIAHSFDQLEDQSPHDPWTSWTLGQSSDRFDAPTRCLKMKFFYVWCHCGVLYEKYKLKNSNANWFSFAVMIQRSLFLFFLKLLFFIELKRKQETIKNTYIRGFFFKKRKKILLEKLYTVIL